MRKIPNPNTDERSGYRFGAGCRRKGRDWLGLGSRSVTREALDFVLVWYFEYGDRTSLHIENEIFDKIQEVHDIRENRTHRKNEGHGVGDKRYGNISAHGRSTSTLEYVVYTCGKGCEKILWTGIDCSFGYADGILSIFRGTGWCTTHGLRREGKRKQDTGLRPKLTEPTRLPVSRSMSRRRVLQPSTHLRAPSFPRISRAREASDVASSNLHCR